MKSKNLYLIMGFFPLCISGYLLFDAIINNNTFSSSNVLMMLSLSIMLFSLSYLHPQIKKKDERMKMIREKGIFYSFLVLIVFLFIFTFLIAFNIITLSTSGAIQLLAPLIIIIVSFSMVILSKVY